MDRKESLEELALALEGAVDQMTRAQRITASQGDDLVALVPTLDKVFADVVALRNEVREQLMKVLATRPKRLPVL